MRAWRHIWRLPWMIWQGCVTNLPGPVGDRLRYHFWKRRLAFLGKGARISEGVIIEEPATVYIGERSWIDRYVIILSGEMVDDPRQTHIRENERYTGRTGHIRIGKECHIAPHSLISGLGGLSIGDRTGIASGAKVYTLSHHYRDPDAPERKEAYSFTPMTAPEGQMMISGPVTIGNDCAVGLNAVILPGVDIGDGSWIGAGEVVKGNVPPGKIISSAKGRPGESGNKPMD